MRAISEESEAQTVQITIAPPKRERGWIMKPNQVRAKFLDPASQGGLSMLRMEIVDEVGDIDKIDILKDHAVKDFIVPVLTAGTKEVDTPILLSMMVADVGERQSRQ